MLEGKTAVITGCLQGIGMKTMEVFAQNKCDIFACSYKQTEEFEQKVEELKAVYGVDIIPVYFDMSDPEALKAAARAIQKEKKPVDILINLAGITRDAYFQMVTPEQMAQTFDVNFFSQIWFSQYIVKLMQRNGKGSVVFTSSIAGLDGNEGQLAYAASKAALVAATKTMSKELAAKGIRVNAIAPGVIKTPMTANLTEEVIAKKMSIAAIPRLGTAEEVANLLLFLASDLSDHITGQVIRVDGGIH